MTVGELPPKVVPFIRQLYASTDSLVGHLPDEVSRQLPGIWIESERLPGNVVAGRIALHEMIDRYGEDGLVAERIIVLGRPSHHIKTIHYDITGESISADE